MSRPGVFTKKENDMDQQALARIAEMEKALNDCTAATAALREELERMDGLREETIALFRYYGSEDWHRDRERALPPGTPAGVLSEDAAYDAFTGLRDAALQMLTLATDILKNRI